MLRLIGLRVSFHFVQSVVKKYEAHFDDFYSFFFFLFFKHYDDDSGFHLDTHQPISFEFCEIIDMVPFFSLVAV